MFQPGSLLNLSVIGISGISGMNNSFYTIVVMKYNFFKIPIHTQDFKKYIHIFLITTIEIMWNSKIKIKIYHIHAD